jgi:hypothetical protein
MAREEDFARSGGGRSVAKMRVFQPLGRMSYGVNKDPILRHEPQREEDRRK